MEPGDFLLAFIDGVTEARDPKGGFFTDQRLVALVEEEPPLSASGLLDRIDTALKQHESGCGLSDDITMLVVRRTPRASPARSFAGQGGGAAALDLTLQMPLRTAL